MKKTIALLLALLLVIFGCMGAAHYIQTDGGTYPFMTQLCTCIYRRTGNVCTGGSAIL